MKTLKLFIALMAVSLSGIAFADVIEIDPSDCDEGVNCWTTNDNSNPSADDIEDLVGLTTDLFLLYKAEVGGADEGSFAEDYSTVFLNTATEPTEATITWGGPSYIDCSSGCYLVIKDGRHEPAVYVFDLGQFGGDDGWDGMMTIELTGFWSSGGGAISNIQILSGMNQVPEPGTLLLLGLGLLGMGLRRRRKVIA